MKLLRLSTIDNKAFFAPDFDTDIILKDNPSIGLKNAMFEVAAAEYVPDPLTTGLIKSLPAGEANNFEEQSVRTMPDNTGYKSRDRGILLNEIEQALNRSCSNASVAGASEFQTFSSFAVREQVDDPEKIVIKYSFNQPLNPFLTLKSIHPTDFFDTTFFRNAPPPFNAIRSTVDFQDVLVPPAFAPVADERYRAVANSGFEFSKGSGVFYAQIHTTAPNVANLTHNGFGIGISFTQDRRASTNPRTDDSFTGAIPETARNNEIAFIDQNANFNYRSSKFNTASTSVVSTLAPEITGNTLRNPILMLEITTESDAANQNRKVIIGSVIQYNGGLGLQTILFKNYLGDKELDVDVKLTPYIYFKANQNNIIVHNVRLTPDNNIDFRNFNGLDQQKEGEEISDKSVYPLGHDHPGGAQTGGTAFGSNARNVDAVMAAFMPKVKPRHQPAVALPEGSITIHNQLIKFLGTTNKDATGDKTFTPQIIKMFSSQMNKADGTAGILCGKIGYNLFFEGMSAFENGSFFIIESMTLSLDSYNSQATILKNDGRKIRSRSGTRKNILATIIQDTDYHGNLVIHEPNEVNMIDINTANTPGGKNNINIRNLRIRILDADLEPIDMVGQGELTLLIDG
jgi:hypothetical protein